MKTKNTYKKEMQKKTYKERLKCALDLIMYNSTSINMAVAANSLNPIEAIEMINYIKENL